MNQFLDDTSARQFIYFVVSLCASFLALAGSLTVVVITQQAFWFLVIFAPVFIGLLIGWRFVR